jgi:hypothetical protein
MLFFGDDEQLLCRVLLLEPAAELVGRLHRQLAIDAAKS